MVLKKLSLKRSILISGHATSVSLELEFWEALKQIALIEKKSVNQIISEIDETRKSNLSSAIRVYVLGKLQNSPK